MCGRVGTWPDSARRELQVEHILALRRGLEVASAELVTDMESEARQGQALLRLAKDAAEARLGLALQGRDQAWGLAQRNFNAWAGAQMWGLHLMGQVDEGTAWISRLVGADVGAILENSAVDPQMGQL
jgi:hypothetical protein